VSRWAVDLREDDVFPILAALLLGQAGWRVAVTPASLSTLTPTARMLVIAVTVPAEVPVAVPVPVPVPVAVPAEVPVAIVVPLPADIPVAIPMLSLKLGVIVSVATRALVSPTLREGRQHRKSQANR